MQHFAKDLLSLAMPGHTNQSMVNHVVASFRTQSDTDWSDQLCANSRKVCRNFDVTKGRIRPTDTSLIIFAEKIMLPLRGAYNFFVFS